MDDYLKKDYGKILKANGLEARRWMKNTSSSTARVYDRNLLGLEITVDLYGDAARIVDYSSPAIDEIECAEIVDLTSRFLYVEKNRIVFLYRKKREEHEQHEKNEKEFPIAVTENGLLFECELAKYVDTGLFLDMAETRNLVKEMSLNQRVLNLFCYTGSFSVYAASGGAESVTSVDLSNVYTAWAKRNLEKNGFLDSDKYSVVTEDARTFLLEVKKAKKTYDLVILDPPAFSNSHKAETFDVQKDHTWFLNMIYSILSDGGVVIFSENLGGFKLNYDELRPVYEIEEITESVYAVNFSHKRKSCRVWVLKKNSEKKRERKERKMNEKLERFDLDLDEKTTKKKREKKEARPFTFDDEEKSVSYKKDDGERRERYEDHRNGSSRQGGEYRRKESSSRYNKKGYERKESSRRDYRERDSERRDGDYRYNRRDDSSRYGEKNYERRESSPRYRDRESFSRYPEKNYSRRDDGYRYDEGDYRASSRYSNRVGAYSKRSEHSSFDRRDSRGGRESYKRSSFHSDERRDTYRGRDGKKKTSPKPFGYDSFMENKSRRGATTSWLEEQEYIDKKED